jgi:hypothetical protein
LAQAIARKKAKRIPNKGGQDGSDLATSGPFLGGIGLVRSSGGVAPENENSHRGQSKPFRFHHPSPIRRDLRFTQSERCLSKELYYDKYIALINHCQLNRVTP